MSSAWSQLEQLLTCAICLDRFRSPRLLPCQHSFCEFCMDGLIDYARRQIKCPECRAEHRIPYNGVASLPSNVTLMRFLELHRSITGEEPDPMPSQLERCTVCTEKTLCSRCAHCEKRTCEDCKEAHLEILRREIQRLVLQIRRGVGRLNEVLEVADKNRDKLAVSRATLKEEISENFRRFLKDLKDKEERMIAQVDEVSESEVKMLGRLKDDLATELEHLTSNCDLADKYITNGPDNGTSSVAAVAAIVATATYEWTDEELVSYKDVFIRSLDFLRNFDYDSPDNVRRLKLAYNTDIDLLRKTFKDFIEVKVIDPVGGSTTCVSGVGGSGGSGSGSGLMDSKGGLQNALMRSQSDHRLVAAFQNSRGGRSGTGSGAYGNGDSERDKSPPGGSLAHRGGSIRDSRLGRASAASERDYDTDGLSSSKSRYLRASDALREWPRPSDMDSSSDYSSGASKFRSRFLRDRQAAEAAAEGGDDGEDALGSLRSVRFDEVPPAAQRPQVFETDSSARAPLSGVTKLADSPAFAERLHQSEVRSRQKRDSSTAVAAAVNSDPTTTEASGKVTAADKTTTASSVPVRTARQISEDEIDKQKKANQAAERAAAAASVLSATLTSNSGSADRSVTGTARVHSPPIHEEINTLTGSGLGSGLTATAAAASSYVTSPRVEQILRDSERSIGSASHTRENSTETSYGSVGSQIYSTPSMDREPMRPHSTTAGSLTDRLDRDRDRLDRERDRERDRISERSTAIATNGYSSYRSYYDRDRDRERDRDTASTAVSSATATADSAATATRATERSEDRNTGTRDTYGSRSSALSSYERPKLTYSAPMTYRSRVARSKSSHLLGRAYGLEESEDDDDDHHNESTNGVSDRSATAVGSSTSAASASGGTAPASTTTTSASSTSSYRSRYGIDTSNLYSPSSKLSGRLSGSRYHYKTRDYSPPYERSSTAAADRTTDRASDKTSTAGGGSGGDGDTSMASSSGPVYQSHYLRSKYGDRSSMSSAATSAAASASASGPLKSRSFHELASHSNFPSSSTTTSRQAAATSSTNGHMAAAGEATPEESDEEEDDDEEEEEEEEEDDEDQEEEEDGEDQDKAKVEANMSSAALTNTMPRRTSRTTDSLVDFMGPAAVAVSTASTAPALPASIPSNYSIPRAIYIQKRRPVFKFGHRGTEPAAFTWPRGVVCGPDNSIVVADSSNHRVQVFDPNGRFAFEFGGYGSGEGEFDCLAGVAVNRIGQFIVSDRYNHRIQIFDPAGHFLRAFGTEGRGDGRFSYPWGIATDSLGFIYVCDKDNHRVQVFQSDGTFVGKFGSIGSRPGQFDSPHYVTVSSTNRVIVSDSNNHRVQVFDVNGRVTATIGGGEGTAEGQFKFPRGIAVDEQGYLIVGDSGNNRVQIFGPDGQFLRAFGCWGSSDAEFKGLEGVAVSSIGNILVCDRENHRIQVF